MKQPAANVIETVDRIKAVLPQLQAAIPPAVKVDIIIDRTTTIRASVSDVQFTLMLTIALVVMVIFLFLRSLSATIIPSITVPLALVGTFALMYVAGFSIDNLSLMGLSIAVGFVVDDAIVMLENIQRHVEEGLSPVEAAIKGAGEIGFTILSISLSLVAVFIPLLLMGGIVGRIFREFAITVTMTIAVSAFVALTLTPVMAARFLKDKKDVHHGRLYHGLGTGVRPDAGGLSAQPRRGAAIIAASRCASSSHGRALGLSVRGHPEGLLPDPGHRLHHRDLRSRPGHFVCRDVAPAGWSLAGSCPAIRTWRPSA